MNKKKILDMREYGSFGYSNTGAIIEAIYELDKTMKELKQDLKEVSKQYKYLWQTIDNGNLVKSEGDGK